VKQLEPVKELYQKLSEKDYSQIVQNVKEFEEELLDAKEQVLDPIRQFINSEEQRKIFDDLKQYVTGDNPNLKYINGEEIEDLKAIYNDREPYKGNTLREAKNLVDSLGKQLKEKIEKEREFAVQSINTILEDLKQREEFKGLVNRKRVK